MDRGAWRATVHGVARSQTRLRQLSAHTRKREERREKRKKQRERESSLTSVANLSSRFQTWRWFFPCWPVSDPYFWFMCAEKLQSCLALCNPVDCSLPGSCVQGILQARILEWAAMPSSRGPRGLTHVSYISCTGRPVLYPLCHLGTSDTSPMSCKVFGLHCTESRVVTPICLLSLMSRNLMHDLDQLRPSFPFLL